MSTTVAPASAATNSATTIGTWPDAQKNSRGTERVFCARKSTNAIPRMSPTINVPHAQPMRVGSFVAVLVTAGGEEAGTGSDDRSTRGNYPIPRHVIQKSSVGHLVLTAWPRFRSPRVDSHRPLLTWEYAGKRGLGPLALAQGRASNPSALARRLCPAGRPGRDTSPRTQRHRHETRRFAAPGTRRRARARGRHVDRGRALPRPSGARRVRVLGRATEPAPWLEL